MSEPEINEDNCVLSEKELKNIKIAFEHIAEIAVTKEPVIDRVDHYLKKVFLKIKKLNDIVKEKQQ